MPKPLRRKTMSLNVLQLRILDVLKQTIKQFNRLAHEDGMSDSEFIDHVLLKLQTEIKQDRYVLKKIDSSPDAGPSDGVHDN